MTTPKTTMSDDVRRQILLEIALSISGELELQSLLGKCLPLFLRKLNCTAAAVVQFREQDAITRKTLPIALEHGPGWPETVSRLSSAVRNTQEVPARHQQGQTSYFGFALTDFGMLVLARTAAFDPLFLNDFLPLTDMLARACRACLEVERRNEVEQELAHSQARQRALLDNLPFLAWMKDVHGRYISVNKAFADRFGIDVQDVIGKSTLDIWPEDKAARFSADDEEILRTGRRLEGRDSEIAADGSIRWFEFSKRPITHQSGAMTGTTGFRWEVTDRVQAEQNLAHRTAFQQVVMDLAIGFVNTPLEELDQGINSALAMIGRFADVDRAYLFRYDFENDVMHNTHEWCSAEIAPEIANLQNIPNSMFPDWVRSHLRGETVHIPCVAELPDSELRRVLEPQGIRTLITLPLIQGETCFGFVGFDAVRTTKSWSGEEISLLKILSELFTNAEARRVHEQRLIQAKSMAEAASRAKSEFLANMSHEIRTPLHGVVSMIDLLQDTQVTADQKEFLHMAETSAETLLSVINDILDFSKIEAGKLELNPRLFDLEEEVHRLGSLISAKAREKDLEMLIRYDPKAPRMVEADNLRLRQVLSNLLTNAVKFTEKGHVLLNVELLFQETDQIGLRFLVEDTGIGIAEDRLNLIFEQFTQVDGSTSRKHGGTGLGLTICQQLVEMMGGSITVGSTVGRGSRFFFDLILPWSRAHEDAAALTNLHGYHALIVDDKAINRRIFSEYLTGWGVGHDAAESAQEALRMLDLAQNDSRRPGYDFLLLDHAMPDMNGLQLAAILNENPHWKNLRMILLTSMWGLVSAEQCATLGLSATLPKPVAGSDLYNAIRNCLQIVPDSDAFAGDLENPDEQSATGPPLPESGMPVIQVLLVDDHPINRKSATLVLEKMGCAVTTAQNGLEALELVQEQAFEIIFMDVQMPLMDGYEATQAIRGLGGQYMDLPIIALTANAMEGDRELCLAAGMTDYLPKPLPRESLMAILAAHRRDRFAENQARTKPIPSGLVLNTGLLLEHYDHDREIAGEMLQDFLADAPSDIAGIRAAIGLRDPGALQATHRLKGPCSYIGAEQLMSVCVLIMEAVQREQWDEADQLSQTLQSAWEAFSEHSAAWLADVAHDA